MRKMKDSGIDLLGQIPISWNRVRLRFLCDITTGNQDTQDANPDGEYPFYVRSPIVEYSDRYTFNGESILMAGDGAGAGKVFHYIDGGKHAVHQRVYRLYDFRGIKGKYLHYFMETLFSFEIDKGSAQTTVPSVRLPMIQNFNICFPSIIEQERIIEFLDSMCKKIDELITDVQSQINILEQYKQSVITEIVTKGLNTKVEMKDSGIAWIGEIPNNTKISRIKYEIVPLSRVVLSSDDIVTCFRDGEVTLRNNRRADGYTISFTEHGYQGVEPGDLVIHGMDAFAGAMGCSDSRGKCTPVVHVCKTTGNNRYFMYYLRSMAYNNVFMDFSNGIRVRSSDFRNFARLGEFPVIVPSLNEQNRIVSYLDKRSKKIEELILKKQEQLCVLEHYKESLIYEYITGKKEI